MALNQGRHAVRPSTANSPYRLVVDSLVIAQRHLRRMRSAPHALISSTVQATLFVLLFAFVFGGAIRLPGGGDYREYLIAGIFAQIVGFASAGTSVGLADDLRTGIMDRFRAMPINPTTIFVGRTLGDLVRAGVNIVVMSCVALLAGWRFHHGVLNALAAFGLFLLFSYAVGWISMVVGLFAPNGETANTLINLVLFPMTFVSNAFVPTQGMPAWLRVAAEWNPISAVVAAGRGLFGNPNPAALGGGSFPMEHPILVTILWSVVLPLVAMPIVAWRFRTASRR